MAELLERADLARALHQVGNAGLDLLYLTPQVRDAFVHSYPLWINIFSLRHIHG